MGRWNDFRKVALKRVEIINASHFPAGISKFIVAIEL